MIGARLLWVGWFGFNVGSELAVDGVAAMVLSTRNWRLRAAVAGWMFAEWIIKGKPSMLGAASGAVAGLVAITRLAASLALWARSFWAPRRRSLLLGRHRAEEACSAMTTRWMCSASTASAAFSAPLHRVSDVCRGSAVWFAEGVTMGGQVATSGRREALTTLVWSGVISFILFKIIDSSSGCVLRRAGARRSGHRLPRRSRLPQLAYDLLPR